MQYIENRIAEVCNETDLIDYKLGYYLKQKIDLMRKSNVSEQTFEQFRQKYWSYAEVQSDCIEEKLLLIPIVGVCVFNVLPIIFMILIAFTNYGGEIVPPALVDWVGFANFGKLIALGEYTTTFFKILGWNIIWAVAATAINYLGGLGLAILLNKKRL